MFRNSCKLRWLATAVLAVSTSVSGVVPLFTESATSAAAEPSAESCCCGTQAGECCGMACCSAKEAPTPDNCPGPARDDGSNARISPLGLIWTQVFLPAALHGRHAWGRSGDMIDRSQADATLQAVHVRLDA
ncbi:MAG: hypothetical protein ACE5KM_17305 [Planctomycetaceae bacterium]